MNLKESIKEIEKCNYECEAGNLLNNKDWIDFRGKVFKINEIIWSLVHGNFSNYSEAMLEISNIFTYDDYKGSHTDQDEFY